VAADALTAAPEESPRPHLYREPQQPTASRYETVARVRSVADQLEAGSFADPYRLVAQMWRNPRLRAMVSTRIAALTKSEVRWKAARDNRDGRAAQRAAMEDWPRIAPKPARWANIKNGLLLGLGLGQPAWFLDPASGRQIPQLRPYSACWARWQDQRKVFQIQTLDAGIVEVAPPSLITGPLPLGGEWIIHEPFGPRSFREAYALSAWYAWLGHNWGLRDRYRSSEKVGQGTVIAYGPAGAGNTKAGTDFVTDVKNIGSSGAIWCERGFEREDGKSEGFDVKPFEWNAANGYQVVDSAVAAAAADLTILFLGHSTQAEAKGGASHALAYVGADNFAMISADDAESETHTVGAQLMGRWAEANFGDPTLAPIREVVTDPPARDAALAQAANQMAQAAESLDRFGVDVPKLFEELGLPMKPPGKGPQVQVPTAQPNETNAQPKAAPAQENA